MNPEENIIHEDNHLQQWKRIYFFGALAAFIALIGIVTDFMIALLTGGTLSNLPPTAADRFLQFNDRKFLGLYNLDLLKMVVQVILIPTWYALFAAHYKKNMAWALLALIIFLFGSSVMVAHNSALPMLELSNKYFASEVESQKALYAAAGEAMLARGAHGSTGIFFGFLIPNIAGLIMSLVMLRSGIFSRTNSWLGLLGHSLMLIYVIIVTFVAGGYKIALVFAIPGGALLLSWIAMFTIKLFSLSRV